MGDDRNTSADEDGGRHLEEVSVGMVERSRDWLDQAEGDLEHAKNDLNSGFYDWACFSVQQSAEKALKMSSSGWAPRLGTLGV